jgi:hypothetical protein
MSDYYSPRVDLDCNVPYLTLAKSGISQIYYVKSGIWLGRPSVQSDISDAPRGSPRPNSPKSGPSQLLEPLEWSKLYYSFGKMENPGTNVDFEFKKIVRATYGEFSEPVFPHNFAQKKKTAKT